MIADKHTHTWFSEDSEENPENSIAKALELGMKDLYFTDHYDIDFPGGAFLFDLDRYFTEMNALKEKYADRINLHIGVELGLKKDICPKIRELVNKYPFEYKIGSIHLVDEKDPYEREQFDMSDEELFRRYFETTLECLKACDGFDAFGHLDYVVRCGYHLDEEYSYEKNAELFDAILEEIVRRDLILEINTKGARRGLKYPHPYPKVLRRYKELGGKRLSMGSDAHRAYEIGAGFAEGLEYVKSFGFTEKNFE